MENLNSKKALWSKLAENNVANAPEGPTSYETTIELEHPTQPACCWNVCFPVAAPKVPRPTLDKAEFSPEF